MTEKQVRALIRLADRNLKRERILCPAWAALHPIAWNARRYAVLDALRQGLTQSKEQG